MEFIWNTEAKAIHGSDGKVSSVLLHNNKTGADDEQSIDGVFIYIGMVPLNEPFKTLGIINDEGYIPTNEKMETPIPGIYAIGDIRENSLRQIVTATGDDSIAAEAAQHYIEVRKTRIRSSFSECVSLSYTLDLKILATSNPHLWDYGTVVPRPIENIS